MKVHYADGFGGVGAKVIVHKTYCGKDSRKESFNFSKNWSTVTCKNCLRSRRKLNRGFGSV